MAKKKRLTRDQLRKKKVAQKAKRTSSSSSLAYSGNKYKTDRLLPLVQATEVGIHEADVMTRRELTDHTVRQALESLVRQLRSGPVPPLDDPNSFRGEEGEEAELICHGIRRRWERLFDAGGRFSREEQIGVLRTLLNSVDTWGTRNPGSRGYLQFVAGFLARGGIHAELTDEYGELVEEEEDELLELGRDWCEGDAEAGREFRREIDQLLAGGAAERIVEVIQRLIGEYADQPAVARELSTLSLRAQALDRPRLFGPNP